VNNVRHGIGINFISLFPWCLLPGFAAYLAKISGYDFLQILPIRGIGAKFKPKLPIKYAEGPWNDGSVISFIKGVITKDPLAPQLIDVIMFPEKSLALNIFKKLRNRKRIKTIVHSLDIGEDQLLEVSPGLWLTPEDIIKKINHRKILVLDLYHLRRHPRPDELVGKPEHIKKETSLLGCWKESLQILLPFAKLIHVSPSRDYNELDNFLSRRNSELEEMLKFIRDNNYKGDFVVETTLKFKGLNLFLLVKTLEEFRKKIDKIINN
jgi:hypothetical protein